MTGSEDGLEVLGKGSPIVYINGRLMRDDSELRRLRSDDIRDVEVINNPGAQYDATVRAVVRIRTKKQQGDGLSLDVNLTDDQDLQYGFNTPRSSNTSTSTSLCSPSTPSTPSVSSTIGRSMSISCSARTAIS